MNIIFIRQSTRETLSIDMNNKPFFFNLYEEDDTIVDPRIAQLSITFNSQKPNNFSRINLETEPCKLEKHFPDPKYEEILKEYNISSKTCINNKDNYNLNITDDYLNNIYYYFNIILHECNNSTLNNNFCYPRDKIKEYFSNSRLYYSIYFSDVGVDHNNQSHPLQEKLWFGEYRVTHNMLYRYTHNVKKVNYVSDEGIILQDNINLNLIGIDERLQLEIALPTNNTFIPNTISSHIIYMLEGKYDSYKRTYQKIQTVIANIGGIMKFILTISKIISSYVVSQILEVELSNGFIFDNSSNNKIMHRQMESEFGKINNINKSSPVKVYDKINKSYPLKEFNKNMDYELLFERRKLKLIEAMIPVKCINKNSIKHKVSNYSKIIKAHLSIESILKLFKDLNGIKYLYLNKIQNELFDYMKPLTIEEHLNVIDKQIQKKYMSSEINNLLKEIDFTDDINRKLYDKF